MVYAAHSVHPDHLPKRPILVSYPSLIGAQRNLERNPGILVQSADDLLNEPRVTDAVLLEMFNALSPTQAKKLTDRATAVELVWALMSRTAPLGEAYISKNWHELSRQGAIRAATEQYLYATDNFVRSEGLRKLNELNAPIPELAPAQPQEENDDMAKTPKTTEKAAFGYLVEVVQEGANG